MHSHNLYDQTCNVCSRQWIAATHYSAAARKTRRCAERAPGTRTYWITASALARRMLSAEAWPTCVPPRTTPGRIGTRRAPRRITHGTPIRMHITKHDSLLFQRASNLHLRHTAARFEPRRRSYFVKNSFCCRRIGVFYVASVWCLGNWVEPCIRLAMVTIWSRHVHLATHPASRRR